MPRRDNIIHLAAARPSEWRYLAYGALAGLAFVELAACDLSARHSKHQTCIKTAFEMKAHPTTPCEELRARDVQS